jgi:predicted nucleic acid-binding protein
MTVVDTSVLVALFDRQDARCDEVRQRFRGNEPLLVAPESLVELLGVLKSKAGRAASDQALGDLMRIRTVTWIHESDPAGSYRFQQAHPGLSYMDAAAIGCALRRGVALWTFDGRQQKAFEAAGGPA